MPSVTVQTDQGAKTINFTKTPTQDVISKVISQQGWKPAAKRPAPGPAPAVTKSPGIFSQADQAIQKPQVEMTPKNTTGGWKNLLPTIGNSLLNTGKDVVSTAYNFAKLPFVAAKNIGYDIPRTIMGLDQNMGQYAAPGQVTDPKTGKPVGGDYPSESKSAIMAGLKNAPEVAVGSAAKGILNIIPALGTLSGVNDNYKPQPMKALRNVAEHPVANILPLAGGLMKPAPEGGLNFEFRGTGEGGIKGSVADMANKVVEKVGGAPGEIFAKAKTAAGKVTSAVSGKYEGTGLPKATGPTMTPEQAEPIIQESISRGVKPSVYVAGRKVTGTQTLARAAEAYKRMGNAIKIIAKNRSEVNVQVDPVSGENISGRPPKTVGEAAIATDDAMKAVWSQSQAFIKASGQRGAIFNPDGTVARLNKIAGDMAYPEDLRNTAKNMIPNVEELRGADPNIIQGRLKIYNSQLRGFYQGTTTAVPKEILAEMAAGLREGMENSIEDALGRGGNQELRTQYRDLKTYQQEISYRAMVVARRAPKGLFEGLTDIGAAVEMMKALTGDFSGAAKALTLKGIGKYINYLNNPDTWIAKGFKAAYEAYPESKPSVPIVGQDSAASGSIEGPRGPGSILPPERQAAMAENIQKMQDSSNQDLLSESQTAGYGEVWSETTNQAYSNFKRIYQAWKDAPEDFEQLSKTDAGKKLKAAMYDAAKELDTTENEVFDLFKERFGLGSSGSKK